MVKKKNTYSTNVKHYHIDSSAKIVSHFIVAVGPIAFVNNFLKLYCVCDPVRT